MKLKVVYHIYTVSHPNFGLLETVYDRLDTGKKSKVWSAC